MGSPLGVCLKPRGSGPDLLVLCVALPSCLGKEQGMGGAVCLSVSTALNLDINRRLAFVPAPVVGDGVRRCVVST